MKICFGLSSGLGNTIFCLPALKALHEMGHELVLYVDADYELTTLWQRCRWAKLVVDGKRDPVPDADRYVSGHWCPPRMFRRNGLYHYHWVNEPDYQEPEWSLALHSARELGWKGLGLPVVHDWCQRLDRRPQWDIGFVPGSKDGVWLRKRYPLMQEIVRRVKRMGLSVVVFGQESDLGDVPKKYWIGSQPIDGLPDLLARCRCVVGTDSGPTHLASSLGVPTAILYTSTSEVKGDPVGRPAVKLVNRLQCRPCQATARWQQCDEWSCQMITIEQVLAAIEHLWQGVLAA